MIGLVALAAAIGLGDFLATLLRGSRIGEIVRESVTIGGWVSMWRPMRKCTILIPSRGASHSPSVRFVRCSLTTPIPINSAHPLLGSFVFIPAAD